MLNLRMEKKPENFARSLRAIGQSLVTLFPECLEIELSGDTYIARGKGRVEAIQPVSSCRTGALGTIWNKLARHNVEADSVQAPSSSVAFEHTYTARDIDQLNQTSAAYRRSPSGVPDIYGLAEKLRTIGRIIDSCGGQLIKIILERETVRFEYRDHENKLCLAEYSNLALYKLQQEYYAGRADPDSTDPWKGSDR